MSTELPTKPGNYYWRESEGDEWQILRVYLQVKKWKPFAKEPACRYAGTEEWVSAMKGQWRPIPTADELVELQAAKKMVDDGIEDAYVVTSVSGRSVSIDFTEARAWSLAERLEGIFRCDLESSGYTCEPVTIARKAKR